MNIVIFTSVRLFGDGLHACLISRDNIAIVAIVNNFPALQETLVDAHADVVLIDITQEIDLAEIRSLAAEWPQLALVALGLNEQRQDVIRCGRAGFAGYVARDATVEALHQAMVDTIAGRLACSADISGGLLRALFRIDPPPDPPAVTESLTRRESDVLLLIGRGLTNKEIARELCLSVATVKHHVHNLLSKLNLPRRAQAMRHVRDMPWIASSWSALTQRKSH